MNKEFYSKANSQATDYQDLLTAPTRSYRRTMTNPWLKTYKIPEDEYVEITKENRDKYFRKKCPICGKEISGRPSEYPYYKLDGNKVAFLCGWCVRLKCVKAKATHNAAAKDDE
ncbi:MAG: hypothetical protein J6N19_02620 [Clostridium sp.]|nr:hypothetical protein [Clostridium sp.]